MYNFYPRYPNPYGFNMPMYNPNNMQNFCPMYPNPYWFNGPYYPQQPIKLKDYGKEPLVIDIEKATKQNNYFRNALWTGCHLQVALMTINPGEDIGLEVHPKVDQFLRIEQGEGLVRMGDSKDNLDFQARVSDDYAIFVPAGKWHNLINTGSTPLKLYSIYAPPEHPYGTVHKTKKDAEEDHGC